MLWGSSVEDLTAEALDAFLRAGLVESTRLDYKLDISDGIEKSIAAFANGQGGMLIFGVDEDKKTNAPIWVGHERFGSGMDFRNGIRELLFQKARDAIFPPVAIRVSQPLAHPHLTSKCLLVVRVDESPDAPHAISKKRECPIYERTENTTVPRLVPADIEYIEALIRRRIAGESSRREAVLQQIQRAGNIVRKNPTILISVSPFYQTRPLCSPSVCVKVARIHPAGFWGLHGKTVQQVPGGTHVLWYKQGDDARCAASRQISSSGSVTDVVSLHESLSPASPQQQKEFACWLEVGRLVRFVLSTIRAALRLYERPEVEEPGYLAITVGIGGAKGLGLFVHGEGSTASSQNPFLDNDFRLEFGVEFSSLKSSLSNKLRELINEVLFSFDVAEGVDPQDVIDAAIRDFNG